MKRLLLGTLSLAFSFTTFAQQEGSAFTNTGRAVSTTFARDYEALGINPANLSLGTGYEGKKIAFGLGEFGISAYSNALTKEQLLGGGEFSKEDAFQNFINSGTAFNVNVAPLSFAFFHEKVGGFAINTTDQMQFFSKLNENTADILVNGYRASYFDSLQIDNGGSIQTIVNDPSQYDFDTLNILKGLSSISSKLLSDLLDGTDINISWTRQYNLGWGKKIISNDKFEMGVGTAVKYVQGFAVMNIGVDDNGDLNVFSSLSPDLGFDVTGGSSSSANFGSAPFLTPVGNGMGLDLGVNVLLNSKIHLGAAVNNIGSMKWTGEAYTVKDTLFTEIESGGFESYNYPSEFADIVSDGDLFEFEAKDELIVKMATNFRFGASIDFIENKLHIGADILVPLNDAPGNFEQPIFGLGGDFRVMNWLEVETGFNFGGNTQKRLNMPIGLTFHVGQSGTWEAGIASRDIITWLRENGPNVSMAMGLLRFRF